MDAMASASDERIGELIRLPEAERARIAFLLLDSIGGSDPDAHLTPEEFRAEMIREAEAVSKTPDDSMAWEEALKLIVGTHRK